ncbi:MAG: hypothetical protein HY331_08640 [Chloroflexi bacterium]|nr:hypothetical protein [Chloroflexota bacterium]
MVLLVLGAQADVQRDRSTAQPASAAAATWKPRVWLPSIAVSRQAPTPTPTPLPTATPVDGIARNSTSAILTRLNSYRAAAGLPPVAETPSLADGALKHAGYMILNWGQFGHFENPTLPGYTPEGDRAARNSNLAWGYAEPADAVDGWMAAIYHRIWLTNPRLQEVGVGWVREVSRTAAVLNVVDGWTDRPGFPYPVPYPPDGMAEVPTRFDGNEIPDPIATCAGYQYPVGYVVSLQFEVFQAAPTISTAQLRDAAGAAVPVCLKPPAERRMYNTLALIPANPLQPSTTYGVEVSGTYLGQPFRRAWQFTTGTAPSAVQAEPAFPSPFLGPALMP